MKEEYTQAFAAGLVDPTIPTPASLTSSGTLKTQRRYNIYRNNVTVSLINALRDMFPVTERLTGPTFFRAMARFYLRETPPSSPLLWEYGMTFPDFIARYEYARELHWLADVARLERLWLDALHSADTVAISIASLAELEEKQLMELRFFAHPATQLLRSRWPVVSIFARNKTDSLAEPFRSSQAENALITRPDREVIVSSLSNGDTVFIERLMQGHSLAGAIASAMAESAEFDLNSCLALSLSVGVFRAIDKQGAPK